VGHGAFYYSHMAAEEGRFHALDNGSRIVLMRDYARALATCGRHWPLHRGLPEWAIGRFEPPAVARDDNDD